MKIVGKQIRKYRNEKGYTQEQLGKLLGVSTQAVSNMYSRMNRIRTRLSSLRGG